MRERKSAWGRVENYRVDLEPRPGRIRVRWGDRCVADSRTALEVFETGHDPVIYLPMKDQSPRAVNNISNIRYDIINIFLYNIH